MTSGRSSVHFITVIGDVGERDFVRAKRDMERNSPGALPDVLENRELLGEIEKNRGFMAQVVVLTDYQHGPEAARMVRAARDMGVENVKVVCCA